MGLSPAASGTLSSSGGGGSFPTLTKPGWWSAPAAGGETTLVLAANEMRGCWVIVPVTVTVSHARINVNGQSGNICVAIYTANGASRLATTGSVACPAAGNADLNLTAPVTLAPGVYWVGFAQDNAVASIAARGGQQVNGGASNAASFPCPAAATTDNGTAGTVPLVGLW